MKLIKALIYIKEKYFSWYLILLNSCNFAKIPFSPPLPYAKQCSHLRLTIAPEITPQKIETFPTYSRQKFYVTLLSDHLWRRRSTWRNVRLSGFLLDGNGIRHAEHCIPGERSLQRQNAVSAMCHCFHTPDRRKNKGGCGQRTLWYRDAYAGRLSFVSGQTSIAPYYCRFPRSELLHWLTVCRYMVRLLTNRRRLTVQSQPNNDMFETHCI